MIYDTQKEKRRGQTTLSQPITNSLAVKSGRGQSGLSPSFLFFSQPSGHAKSRCYTGARVWPMRTYLAACMVLLTGVWVALAAEGDKKPAPKLADPRSEE